VIKAYLLVVPLLVEAYHVYSKCTKVIGQSIHVVFDQINNGLARISLFDEFQLTKYTNGEDEEAQDKSIIKMLLPI